jgi:hypothetical protein
MNLLSSFGQRVVDGALAAAFVQDLRLMLEHPAPVRRAMIAARTAQVPTEPGVAP